MQVPDPLPFARTLLQCASVTPADAGAQAVVAAALMRLGFLVTHLPFGETPNLFARKGETGPHFCFAGHTDVVPTGGAWSRAPFGAEVVDGSLYGRGACDMKGAIAAFIAAADAWVQAGAPGSVSLLITGDEEGPGTDGTVRVLEWMAGHGQIPDFCLVGEPTNPRKLGEVIKVGRRGSLNAAVTTRGRQGHAAYPQNADNPVHRLIAGLAEILGRKLDDGTDMFEPSGVQVVSVDVGNPASNVIPAQATAKLNIRFNDRHTGASLEAWLSQALGRHCADFDLAVQVSGEAFLTRPGREAGLLRDAVTAVTGLIPRFDTGGGTSDARFVSRYCPVAEFGLVGATMHQVDEAVPVAELRQLAEIYAAMLRAFFA